LFVYTDGVIDTLGEHDRFGAGRLKRLLAEHGAHPPERLLSELAAGLDRFQVGPQADDTAALALRPVPVATGAGAQPAHPVRSARNLPVF
jgi:serine phosphatase RsbU (regulator of sigma subunit)